MNSPPVFEPLSEKPTSKAIENEQSVVFIFDKK
jgi:hypothetical protein